MLRLQMNKLWWISLNIVASSSLKTTRTVRSFDLVHIINNSLPKESWKWYTRNRNINTSCYQYLNLAAPEREWAWFWKTCNLIKWYYTVKEPTPLSKSCYPLLLTNLFWKGLLTNYSNMERSDWERYYWPKENLPYRSSSNGNKMITKYL